MASQTKTDYQLQHQLFKAVLGMRVNIVHPGAGELSYEIRGIVDFAQKLAATGIDITWENIGDPVAKGEEVPKWIRDIVKNAVNNGSRSYAYSPTKGLNEAREFLARQRTKETGNTLKPDNILFFNGLGDAINKTYTWLNPVARVLGPSPAYPTHSSIEGAHGRSMHLTYKLDINNEWMPDIEDIRSKVKHNPTIAGLLLISPDNPTGAVYPRRILQQFVDIAKQYELFLIADEIYANLAYDQEDFTPLAMLTDGVPTIIMRGLSKEVPWPGSRCGWLEFYNLHVDESFDRYAKSIEEAKMTEVCSTTLPQIVLPEILGDQRYTKHLSNRRQKYVRRAEEACKVLNNSPAFKVIKPKGAFYLAVTLTDKFVKSKFKLKAANAKAQKLLDKELTKIPEHDFDKRFCYQLMANTGVCVVPLSTGFNSYIPGFRMTLLEPDDAKFSRTLSKIASVLK